MKRIILSVLIVLSLSGCGAGTQILLSQYGINESDARVVATNAALGTAPPPAYQTAAAGILGVTLTPTPQMQYGPPTLSVQDQVGTMVGAQQNIALTKAALDLVTERERIAALEQAQWSMATAGAAKSTAEAIDAVRTADARKAEQAATAKRNDENTQVALVNIQGTQAAQGVQTQQAAQQTQAVAPTHDMWTMTAISVQQRILNGQARDVELAVRRQEMTNGFDAYGPWLLVIFVMLVSSEGFKKWLKTRVFKRDEHGKLPVISMEGDDGTKVLTKLDQIPSPIVRIDKTGNVDLPKPNDPEEQKDINRRQQAIEAISFLPSPYAQQGTKMMNTEFGGRGAPQIQVRSDKAMTPVLMEADAEILEES